MQKFLVLDASGNNAWQDLEIRDLKESVRAATTSNITLSDEQTIDGVAVKAGNRVLVKDQTDAKTNGIYVAVKGAAWVRSEDFNASAEVSCGAHAYVEEGTANAKDTFVLSTANPIVLGTTELVFSAARDKTAMRRFAAAIGDGNATEITVTHNLGTKDVTVQGYTVASGAEASFTFVRATANTVVLTFQEAPAENAVRVVVMG